MEYISRRLTHLLALLAHRVHILCATEAMMKKRKYPRLKDFDYRSEGAYFLTLVCHQRMSRFGHISAGKMVTNLLGEKVKQAWYDMPLLYNAVSTDAFVIMPNHLHGILWINAGNTRTIPQMMSLFKGGVTRDMGFKIWQRSFYDRVIRDENELSMIRQYIEDNPERWELDRLYIPGAHECAPYR